MVIESTLSLNVSSRSVSDNRTCGHGESWWGLATRRVSCLVVLIGSRGQANPLNCHDGRQFRPGEPSRTGWLPGSCVVTQLYVIEFVADSVRLLQWAVDVGADVMALKRVRRTDGALVHSYVAVASSLGMDRMSVPCKNWE